MNSAAYRVRRATLEDLEALTALWTSMNLPADDLKNRLTEFQVADDSSGKVVGAVGFQIVQRHGLVHSEGFTDFAVADQLRTLLWGRIQALAMNHGIYRLWTREIAPFWTHCGLQPATEEALGRMPETWDRTSKGWFTLRLKDEDAMASLDKEFAMFKEAEKRNTAETLGQARKVKQFLTVVGLIASAVLIAAALYLIFRQTTESAPQ